MGSLLACWGVQLITPALTESRASTISLTEAQADQLRMVGKALRSQKAWWGDGASGGDPEQSGRTAIRVEQKSAGRFEVVVYNAVGVIGLSGMQIVVQPKIPMRHLLYLLTSSSELPAKSTSEIVSVGDDASLFELIARWFLDAAEKLIRLGLDRDYERRKADLTVVRGRVDLLPTIRAVKAGRPAVRCEFDNFSEDTSLNRTLKAAARAVSAAALLPQNLRARGRRIAEKLHAASDLQPNDLYVVPDRNRPHYRDAHQLAALILKSSGIQVGYGTRAARTFLLRTPDAVEEGVRGALSGNLPPGLAVKRGGKELLAGDANGTKKRRVTPDFVLGDDLAIGDVKYMNTNADISTAHLYQVTTFATAYKAQRAAVIGFGDDSVDATVQVGDVKVRGFRWNTAELEPASAAAHLASDVSNWLISEL
jgi:5-methylcytosine-specific restriction enzyme subunit McrC